MSEDPSEYTLLIVESPTLARRLKDLVPDSVFVISTGGFLWKPVFDRNSMRLRKKAIADKLSIRKHIREEAKHAVHIIVATDSDPSGDFIAWSLHRDLKSSRIRRGQLSALTRPAIYKMLTEAENIDFQDLHRRLENRFRIRKVWSEVYPGLSMAQAGLYTLFVEPNKINRFVTDSHREILCRDGIDAVLNHDDFYLQLNCTNKTGWIISQPLSTFDAVTEIAFLPRVSTFTKAQNLLQKLFESVNPETGEGLVTYPRTEQRAYFPESWAKLEREWIRSRSLNEFMPLTLRSTADANQPHDAIRPTHLDLSPDWVESHMPSDIGSAYRLIYERAKRSIQIPSTAASTFIHDKSGTFLVSKESVEQDAFKVRPLLTFSELGHALCRMGVLRPSRFGQFVDEARCKNWIATDQNKNLRPGSHLVPSQFKGKRVGNILRDLHSVADKRNLSDETIRYILSS